MRKITLLFFLLSVCFVGNATYKAGYYDKMEGKKKEELKAAVKECVSTHTRLDYTNLPNNWIYTDVYPDLVNGNKRWWEMYSYENYYITGNQTGLSSFRANNMQREHSVPKSWWGSDDTSPAWTDIYNLYPSDGPANMAKSNYPLGPVGTATFDNGCTKVGIPAAGYGGTSGYVFEPADEYKGDFARAYFYVFTVYNDLNWTSNSMGVKNDWPTLKPWAYEMLLQWSRQDPVSQKEITRNDAAERQQGNRNPFIDFPELAEYIWGTKTSEAFYIADQDGSVTPPLTGDPELNAPVNGETLDFGECAIGSSVSAPLIISGSNISSALSVLVTGSDKAMFTVETRSISASNVNQQGGTKLNIFYKPTAVGRHSASLTLYDGGLDVTQQVNVTLTGEALEVPTLSTLTALEATNVGDDSYYANWTAAPEVVDYYVLTRTKYTESGQVTTTFEAEDNMLEVTDRDASVAESYYVQSSRLGYLSTKSNTVMVAANGIGANTLTQPLLLGIVDGGFIILNEAGATNLRIVNMAGITAFSTDFIDYGTRVELPSGIYMVTAANANKPLKLMVK
jgi:endonuclease I